MFQFSDLNGRRCTGIYGVKFSLGKIFLGDGGAYALGTCLSGRQLF